MDITKAQENQCQMMKTTQKQFLESILLKNRIRRERLNYTCKLEHIF